MAIQMVREDVVAVLAYATDPYIDTGNIMSTFSAINESSADDIFISLDGVNDHAHLVPGITSGIVFAGKYTKIWARVGTPTAIAVMAQMIAEG